MVLSVCNAVSVQQSVAVLPLFQVNFICNFWSTDRHGFQICKLTWSATTRTLTIQFPALVAVRRTIQYHHYDTATVWYDRFVSAYTKFNLPIHIYVPACDNALKWSTYFKVCQRYLWLHCELAINGRSNCMWTQPMVHPHTHIVNILNRSLDVMRRK